ncbi:unnamed protein product [Phytophthora fragariaefolia]|uniref:Unnamed protein product n=1 Tax=Phytophthora fragariaefolia TaxID=1490495 RepID=A0A9W7CS63_9STRA|nr:unnamed protein product [Phytophthora fragariaefolia]
MGRGAKEVEMDEQDDPEFPEKAEEASDNAVDPKQLLPPHLRGALAADYLALLTEHQALYDGHLGRMQFADYELALIPDFKPVYAKPYPIARRQEEKAKLKIQLSINDDVKEKKL